MKRLAVVIGLISTLVVVVGLTPVSQQLEVANEGVARGTTDTVFALGVAQADGSEFSFVGTGFIVLDLDGEFVLVTAAHVADGLIEAQSLQPGSQLCARPEGRGAEGDLTLGRTWIHSKYRTLVPRLARLHEAASLTPGSQTAAGSVYGDVALLEIRSVPAGALLEPAELATHAQVGSAVSVAGFPGFDAGPRPLLYEIGGSLVAQRAIYGGLSAPHDNRLPDTLVLNASVGTGQSGSPVFQDNKVIGVVTTIVTSPWAVSGTSTAGISNAQPSLFVQDLLRVRQEDMLLQAEWARMAPDPGRTADAAVEARGAEDPAFVSQSDVFADGAWRALPLPAGDPRGLLAVAVSLEGADVDLATGWDGTDDTSPNHFAVVEIGSGDAYIRAYGENTGTRPVRVFFYRKAAEHQLYSAVRPPTPFFDLGQAFTGNAPVDESIEIAVQAGSTHEFCAPELRGQHLRVTAEATDRPELDTDLAITCGGTWVSDFDYATVAQVTFDMEADCLSIDASAFGIYGETTEMVDLTIEVLGELE